MRDGCRIERNRALPLGQRTSRQLVDTRRRGSAGGAARRVGAAARTKCASARRCGRRVISMRRGCSSRLAIPAAATRICASVWRCRACRREPRACSCCNWPGSGTIARARDAGDSSGCLRRCVSRGRRGWCASRRDISSTRARGARTEARDISGPSWRQGARRTRTSRPRSPRRIADARSFSGRPAHLSRNAGRPDRARPRQRLPARPVARHERRDLRQSARQRHAG